MKTNDKWKIYSDAELFTMLSGTQLEIDGSFHELYRRYSVRIYGYCRRMVGDGAAEDVCQDIFLSFLDHGKKKTPINNVAAYLFRIAQNKTRRQRSNEVERTMEEFKEELFSASNLSPEERETNQLVSSAMELLPDDYRETLALQVYGGMTYEEIAAVRRVPISTVRNHILRAKKKIRELLLPFFQDESK
ncbi:MAG: RNA polymerase sigma factor [Ignavibacteriae bacterium]|nr:RNA polymerase sigma factor [Ignavibacteriota bacterium]